MSTHNQHDQISPLMHELSNYIAGALKRKLPAEVAERAKIQLVDSFAALISGSRLLPGKRAINYVASRGARREVGVVGTRIVTSAPYAALANGVFGHADETDDVHPPSRSHPGSSITPATLAMAELQQSSGEQMLRAFVLGYDINARVLLAVKHKQLTEIGFHCGSKGGVFGGGAACGALLKLDTRKIRYLLSYCAQQAAGLRTNLRAPEHLEKAYVCGGMTAQHAVEAAQMTASGFTGVDDVFVGEHNFFNAFSRDPDPAALVQGLGKDYEIMRCGLKRWSAGAPIQAPLHVLHDLMREHGFKGNDVEQLVVRMPDKELEVVDDRDMGEITVQHLLAIMLVDGTVTFKAAHDHKRTKDARVVKLRRDHIKAVGDPGLTDPLRRWRCAMEITLKDGRKLTGETMAAKGGVDNPLPREAEEDKARDLMGPVLGKQRAQQFISTLFDIEKLKDARTLRKLYSA